MSRSQMYAANMPVLRSVLLEEAGIGHGFFGRRGGVSLGEYASLNAGLDSGDDPSAIAENRTRIARVLGVEAERLLSARQVHSADAVIVDSPWEPDARPSVDAMATATPGVALAIATADCAPVLLADADARVIGAAHAGWRGAFSGIIEAVVTAMASLGAQPCAIRAVIGPCIGQAAYEVGPEFRDGFVKADSAYENLFIPGDGDRLHFDLKTFVAQRLNAAGVVHVDRRPDCTFADEIAYFSHRRGVLRGAPERGRNLSAIVLEANDG